MGRPPKPIEEFPGYHNNLSLPNQYHPNPHKIGKEATATTTRFRGHLSTAEGEELREANSKCVTAWLQPEAYSEFSLQEFCADKNKPTPDDIAKWLKFCGDGRDGLQGWLKYTRDSWAKVATTLFQSPATNVTLPEAIRPSDAELFCQQFGAHPSAPCPNVALDGGDGTCACCSRVDHVQEDARKKHLDMAIALNKMGNILTAEHIQRGLDFGGGSDRCWTAIFGELKRSLGDIGLKIYDCIPAPS
mmetsp:Transcript_31395/g.52742  ORF Transcript_31395/g.52742 Transcript_31395/m.52742 type:complete len:246 (+) Transcript_31395:155-892(+)